MGGKIKIPPVLEVLLPITHWIVLKTIQWDLALRGLFLPTPLRQCFFFWYFDQSGGGKQNPTRLSLRQLYIYVRIYWKKGQWGIGYKNAIEEQSFCYLFILLWALSIMWARFLGVRGQFSFTQWEVGILRARIQNFSI